jgi:diguanylate cyclase
MSIKKYIHIFIITSLIVLIPSSFFSNLKIHADNHIVLESASEFDYPPFSVVTDGAADGFSVELLKAVANEMGLNIQFKVDHWNIIKQELEDGKLDVLPLVGYSQERDEVFDFTIPYIVMRGNIFVRDDYKAIRSEDDLFGKEIIVMRGDNSQEYAELRSFTDKLILVNTYAEAFELLSSGKHDAVLAQSLVGEKLINDLSIKNVKAVTRLADNGIDRIRVNLSGYEQKFSFAVQEGNKELLAQLNEGLAIVIENGTYETLYEEWFTFLIDTTPDYTQLFNLIFAIIIFLIMLMLLISFFVIRKEVKRQTFKLKNNLDRNTIMFNVINQEHDSVSDWLDYVLNQMIKMTGSEFGYIYLYQEENNELILNAWSHEVKHVCRIDEKIIYSLDETGLCGEVIRQRKPITINDFTKVDKHLKDYPQEHISMKKWMGIPVFEDNRIVATVGLANKAEDYDENDIYQVTLLMDGVWNRIEKAQNRDALEIAKNKYLSTIVSIGDGVMVVGLDEKIEMINKACADMTGWQEDEAIGLHYKDVFMITHEKANHDIVDPVLEVLMTKERRELSNHTKLTSKDGKFYMIESSAAPVHNLRNEMLGVVLVFRDMTIKHNHIKEIEYLSYHDSLTGLYNRRFFEEEFNRLDTPRNYPLTIIMADLNGLKITNDAFGHHAGDDLLRTTASLFKTHLRAEDIAARWGGDEFAILMPKTSSLEAELIVQRITQGIEAFSKEAGVLSIAFGWETKTDKSMGLDDLFKNAEEYMYKRKVNESQGVRGLTIKTIMNTLFEKSPREEQHSQRVKDMAIRIAKVLNLPQHEIDDIATLGLLHDIGKIIIPTEILEKKGPLTDVEFAEIKKHPSIGYRILISTKEFSSIADAVLSHHERWDGKGYPNKIKGEKIPLKSRIIAIADAYDAMTNSRPYRESGISQEEARQEIIDNAGTQFDPDIVALVIENKII